MVFTLKENFYTKKVLEQLIALFFVQISSTIAFAVFYAGLSIYLTQNQHLSTELATLITGLFLSLNYFLPLISGIIANHLISYKRLFLLSKIASIVGCLLLAVNFVYFGLALFLMSSFANVSLKMFLTQLFSPEQIRQRRVAFIWNYVGMNLGFMLGFLLTGICSKNNHYASLFIFMGLFTLISLLLAWLFIKEPQLQSTILKPTWNQFTVCSLIFIFLTLLINFLFHHVHQIHNIMTISIIIVFILTLLYCYFFAKKEEKNHLIKFIYFSCLSIAFWTLYMLTPIAIMQLIEYNVNRDFLGFTIEPSWFTCIDSIIIMLVAPSIASAAKTIKFFNDSSHFFVVGFLCVLCGFILMTFGIYFPNGIKISFWIVLAYLILITLGEIFISPINDSLIGELVPEQFRGIIAGANRVILCIGVLLASCLSNQFILPYINKNGITAQNSIHLTLLFLVVISCILFILMLLISSILRNKNLTTTKLSYAYD